MAGGGSGDRTRRRPAPHARRQRRDSMLARTMIGDADGMQIQLGGKIGKGSFGVVHRGLHIQTSMFVAVKKVATTSESQREDLYNEVEVLSSLHHPNIVCYLGTIVDDDHAYIVMEYADCGTLSDVVHGFGPMDEVTVAHHVNLLLRGLDYLHKQGVVHRDIKGANVMTTKDGETKLVDFGIAAKLSDTEEMLAVQGSPNWMAPEVISLEAPCSTASDIWSLGCTIIELLDAAPPYADQEPMQVLYSMVVNDVPPYPEDLSPKCIDFLDCCLVHNPAGRWTVEQLLDHEFLENARSKTGTRSGGGSTVSTGSAVHSDSEAVRSPTNSTFERLTQRRASVDSSANLAGVRNLLSNSLRRSSADSSSAGSSAASGLLSLSGSRPISTSSSAGSSMAVLRDATQRPLSAQSSSCASLSADVMPAGLTPKVTRPASASAATSSSVQDATGYVLPQSELDSMSIGSWPSNTRSDGDSASASAVDILRKDGDTTEDDSSPAGTMVVNPDPISWAELHSQSEGDETPLSDGAFVGSSSMQRATRPQVSHEEVTNTESVSVRQRSNSHGKLAGRRLLARVDAARARLETWQDNLTELESHFDPFDHGGDGVPAMESPLDSRQATFGEGTTLRVRELQASLRMSIAALTDVAATAVAADEVVETADGQPSGGGGSATATEPDVSLPPANTGSGPSFLGAHTIDDDDVDGGGSEIVNSAGTPSSPTIEEVSSHIPLFHLIPSAMVLVDSAGVICSVNGAFTARTGYTTGDVRGKDVQVLIADPSVRARHRGLVADMVLEKGENRIVAQGNDSLLQCKDKSIVPVRVTVGQIAVGDGSFMTAHIEFM